MLCKVIATPAAAGRGAFQGWDFIPDDGRALSAGEIRFTYNPTCKKHTRELLRQALRDYKDSIEEYWRDNKASKQSLEYTQAMRARKIERERFIREGRTLQYKSL